MRGVVSISRVRTLACALVAALPCLPCCGQQGTSPMQEIAEALQQHQYAKALQETDNLLRLHPEDSRVWTLKGVAQNGEKNWREAMVSFERAVQLQPSFVPALEGAAQTAYLNGDPDAMRYVQRLLAVRPQDGVTNAMAGVLAYQAHDCSTANSYFEHSHAQLLGNPRAADQAADCLMQAQRTSEAVALLSESLERRPDRIDLGYNLGLAYVRLGEPARAIEVLKPFQSQKDADLLNLLGNAYTDAKLPDDAFRSLEQAIEANPKQEKSYLDLAILCLEHNQEKRAIAAATAGVARIPKPVSLYLIRGVAYAQLADYSKAEADFTVASTMEPDRPNSTIAMSLLLSDRNQLAQERTLLEQQLAKTPTDPVTNFLYADLLVRMGLTNEPPVFQTALQSASVATAGRPDSAEAQVLMAKLLEQKGDASHALEHLQIALKLDPKDQTALNREILLLNKLHKRDEAALAVRQLRDLINSRMEKEQDSVRVDGNAGNGQSQP